MAKKSQINRNLKRQKTVARFASRRQALKAIIRNPESSFDERQEAMAKLQAMPRDASATRIKNRCPVSGRSKGYYRKFNMSRIALREHALQGFLPGVVKASW
ncbi:MAG: 30S ribosomal protein S14 [Myxococcota bacterium]|nr:30S ribosomal protein S14 [Myxococcota bacterium]